MRRGDDPDIDAHGPLAADAHHLAILDDAKQADLRSERELGDLVEEERPAVGLLEPAFTPRRRAGERPLLVSEELRVDELRGDGAAVDAAERPAAERRVLVDGAGNDLLAGARFAEEQDRSAAPRYDARAGHHRGESGVAANQPIFSCPQVSIDQMRGQVRASGSERAFYVTYAR